MSVNTAQTYTDSVMNWTEPTFLSGCPRTSGYSTWSGLGGWNLKNGQHRLIQAGVDTINNETNGMYPFWEMLTDATNNPEVEFIGNIHAGDQVRSEAYFSGFFAVFSVIDSTLGTQWTTGDITTYAGHATSYYWDGTTSDFITEAPTISGRIADLREPSSQYVYVSAATTNKHAISTYNSWAVIQETSGGKVLDSTTFDGVNPWSDDWNACE